MIAGIILAGLAVLAGIAMFVLLGLLRRAVARNAARAARGVRPPASARRI
jgi:hypothetical protein